MPLRAIAFLILYAGCALGALFAPHLGIYGYVGTYCIGPENEWWSVPFRHWGIRFSLVMAIMTALGMLLNWGSLRKKNMSILSQEMWTALFIFWVCISSLWGIPIVVRYTTVDPPQIKMVKVGIFLFMYTRLIHDLKKLDLLLWTLVASSLVLGIEAWETPWSAFQSGRLERIGGADFAEANFFAAFMAAMLPIIGVQFLRSGWKGKAFSVLSGAFTANAIILCRSRGAFVSLVAGIVVAASYVPKKYRKQVYAALLLGILGGVHLADPQFFERIATVTRPIEGQQLDQSAANRTRLWKAGFQIMWDHPLGTGPGSWFQTIGDYIPDLMGRDAHSTYVRAMGELGVPGIFLLLLCIFSAFRSFRLTLDSLNGADEKTTADMERIVYGVRVSLVVILIAGVFITMTYTETIWLIMMLPSCILRAAVNERSCFHR